MKTNFKKDEILVSKEFLDSYKMKYHGHEVPTDILTAGEFEDYIIKSGAMGSFMIYRSEIKKDELGLDEI